jgi:deferrochelatase/peroxidase EfeB
MAKSKSHAVTSFDLTKPIDPSIPASELMLSDLQGNILKGHGRDNTVHLFLQFKPGKEAEVKTLIQQFAADFVTSALEQQQENEDFKQFGISGSVFGNFLITHKGYQALGISSVPGDASFQNGMQNASLNDPRPAEWEKGLSAEIHAMLLLADDDSVYLQSKARDLMTQWRKAATILAVELGKGEVNGNGDHVEHFGYVDGRSQPLFYTTDIEHEKVKGDGTTVWDPSAPPSLVLVADPNGGPQSFGSYFVFRKLEQNVRGFKTMEKQLAEALGFEGEQKELAGAQRCIP